ncbi:hypothetical protein ANO14919_131720 [Xylariales sp. No.14919]|nr:hypothetical protein ANO14919_131720 [Xylariales sp. No.14919]
MILPPGTGWAADQAVDTAPIKETRPNHDHGHDKRRLGNNATTHLYSDDELPPKKGTLNP